MNRVGRERIEEEGIGEVVVVVASEEWEEREERRWRLARGRVCGYEERFWRRW